MKTIFPNTLLINLLVLLLLITAVNLKGQKQIIDSAALVGWRSLLVDNNRASISSNGDFVTYEILNNWSGVTNSVVIQNVNRSDFKYEFEKGSFLTFSANNRLAIIQKSDSLIFLSLKNLLPVDIIAKVSRVKQPENKGEWLSYSQTDHPNIMIIRNVITGKEVHIDSVTECAFAKNGRAIVFKTVISVESKVHESLYWMELSTNRQIKIWETEMAGDWNLISSYFIDANGTQVVFLTKNRNDIISNTIWYFRKGLQKAVVKVSENSFGISSNQFVSPEAPYFNDDGRYIFFNLKTINNGGKATENSTQVDVWSYKDSVLQSTQLEEQGKSIWTKRRKETFAACLNVDSNNVVRLEGDDEAVDVRAYYKELHGDFALITTKTQSIVIGGRLTLKNVHTWYPYKMVQEYLRTRQLHTEM